MTMENQKLPFLLCIWIWVVLEIEGWENRTETGADTVRWSLKVIVESDLERHAQAVLMGILLDCMRF